MDMNDKEYPEFWDNEPDDDDDDDDEYDLGSDVDANNDETFDNAAEWNEDEHEELIARDSILSHTIRGNHHSSSSRGSNNISINNITTTTNNNNNHSIIGSINNNGNVSSSGGSPFGRSAIGSISSRAGWGTLGDKDYFTSPQSQSSSSDVTWRSMPNAANSRLNFMQQQTQLLIQKQYQEQQQLRERQILQQQRVQQDNIQASPQRQIFTVDELERQLMKSRIDQSATVQQQRQQQQQHQQQQQRERQFLQQQQQQQPRVQPENIQAPPQRQVLTVDQLERQLLKSRADQHCAASQQTPPRPPPALAPQNTNISSELLPKRTGWSPFGGKDLFDTWKDPDNKHDRFNKHDYGGEVRERDGREYRDQRGHRDFREHRDHHHRDHRDHHRDGRDNHNRHHQQRQQRDNRRQYIIIPPQVQLEVIDKVKCLQPAAARATDEFLQDKMVPSKEALIFKKCSSSEKALHDGVLTEKERNWLTKIQEKIQADYDDNLDQDYYYLLYFNRSSMTDEAANKPCGPGVLDRRFIPRERLLYNSNT